MTQVVVKWSKWISLILLGLLFALTILICTLLFTNPGLNIVLWGAEKFVPQLHVGSTSGAVLPRFSLNQVTYKDDSLNVDLEASSVTLAVNASCFTEPSICIDEVAIDGLNFAMPELPASPDNKPAESSPNSKITAPLPVSVSRIALTNIDLDVLDNQVQWKHFTTGISFIGNRLRVAKTTLNGMAISLAKSEEISQTEQELAEDKPINNSTQQADFELPVIELPFIELPLQIELTRLDVNDFELKQETPIIVDRKSTRLNSSH